MDDRNACRQCGEMILKTARLCPHCKESALVEVVLTTSVNDERMAYRAARELEKAAIPSVSFLDLKRGLQTAPGVLAGSLTAAEADELNRRLEGVGIAGREVRASHGPGREASPRSRSAPTTTRLWLAFAVFWLALAVVWFATRNRTSEEPADPVPSAQKIAQQVISSTVQLRCKGQVGTGFFVAPELLLSNAHVVCKTRDVDVVFASGLVAKGRVIQRDDWFDYSVIEVKGASGTPLPIADASTLERGDPVFFAGNPKGLDSSFSRGIISHPERFIFGVGYLQVDAAINPGNSGGPLLNGSGEVIGLVTMVVGEGSNLGLALPINYLAQAKRLGRFEAFTTLENNAWSSFLSRARAQNHQAIDEFRARRGEIDLLGFEYTDQGNFRAVVIQWNDETPAATHLDFELVDNDRTLCRPNGTVERWSRGASKSELEDMDPRLVMWLERNRLMGTLYLARPTLAMRGCPDPLTVLRADLHIKATKKRDDT